MDFDLTDQRLAQIAPCLTGCCLHQRGLKLADRPSAQTVFALVDWAVQEVAFEAEQAYRKAVGQFDRMNQLHQKGWGGHEQKAQKAQVATGHQALRQIQRFLVVLKRHMARLALEEVDPLLMGLTGSASRPTKTPACLKANDVLLSTIQNSSAEMERLPAT